MLARTPDSFTKGSLRIHQYSSTFSILHFVKKIRAAEKIPVVKKNPTQLINCITVTPNLI